MRACPSSRWPTHVASSVVGTRFFGLANRTLNAPSYGLRRDLRPGRRAARHGMEVARREAFVAERVEELRVVAEEHRGDLATDADHLVPVVRVEDPVDVRAHVVEDR